MIPPIKKLSVTVYKGGDGDRSFRGPQPAILC